jgi:hypothetical protein
VVRLVIVIIIVTHRRLHDLEVVIVIIVPIRLL